MNTILKSGLHPDADQLSAFAEHALPQHEQQQMLVHLAACPDCRALVNLTHQADSIEPAQPQAVAIRRPRFSGWLSGWRLVFPAAALACLILLTLHLRNASTPGSHATPTATASTKHIQPPLPASPIKLPASPASAAAASPAPVPTKSTLAPRQKKQQPTERITAATIAAPAAPLPAPAAQEAQLTPQTHQSGEIELTKARVTGIGNGSGAGLATGVGGELRSVFGGGITGTVTDPQNKVVPNAQVTATNTDTGVAVTRQTTRAGLYSISPLPVGTYNVEVVAGGFQRLLQENVNVDTASMRGLPLKLTIGGANETVTVKDAPPYLNTASATLGGTIENQLYSQLPLTINGGPRSPMAFQYLMPGVQENPANATNQGNTAGVSGIYGGSGQTNLNANYVEGMPASNINAQGSGNSAANTASSNAANASSTGAGAAALARMKRPVSLPSKLPALSVVENAGRTVALDAAGALFRSEDAGVTWLPVPAQWQGRALALRLSQPPSAVQRAAAINTANASEARQQTQALPPPAPAFELTTDSGAIYTSTDGQTWQHK